MKILHLGKYYPPSRGGMETVLREICAGLLQRGHEVAVLVAGADDLQRSEDLAAAPPGAGRLDRLACLGRFNSQPLVPGLAGALRREIRRNRPQIVHLHLPNPGACLAWLLQGVLGTFGRERPRLAVWYHADITRQRLAGALVKPLIDLCLDAADGVCVSSAALRDHSPVLASLRRKVRVIPFGIDLDPWLRLEPTGDGPFLFVGRLVYYKGVEHLLEAVARVAAASLTIVGEGPRRASLERRVADLGLEDRVVFTGEVDEPRLRELMSRARALVLPSAQAGETFGLVQLEAMAAGLPVISTALPTGVAEVGLDEVTGRSVPPADVSALAGALSELLTDSDLGRRRGQAGRDRARECFSRRRMLDDLEAWYRHLEENPS